MTITPGKSRSVDLSPDAALSDWAALLNARASAARGFEHLDQLVALAHRPSVGIGRVHPAPGRSSMTTTWSENSGRSSSRATRPTVWPSSSTSRTAPALNSSVNRRRGRLGFAVFAIVDIVSAFQNVSTEADQAHTDYSDSCDGFKTTLAHAGPQGHRSLERRPTSCRDARPRSAVRTVRRRRPSSGCRGVCRVSRHGKGEPAVVTHAAGSHTQALLP